MLENSILIKELEEYSLNFLIPEYDTTDDSDEGIGHQFDGEPIDPGDSRFYDGYFMYEETGGYQDEDEVDLLNEPEYDRIECDQVWNVDSLMRAFDCDYMEYNEFLNLNIWDLFGITKRQFDLIDWSHINATNFTDFFISFINSDLNESIEKRIKYSTIDALTNCFLVRTYGHLSRSEYLKYAKHIMDTHTVDECWEIFPMLNDYYRFLDDALLMNAERSENGDPVFKYEVRPKVSKLKDLHDKAFRDHREMETKRMTEDRENLNRRIRTISQTPDYTQFLYSSNKYVVKPVQSQNDLDEEGSKLEHCVASYGSYMASGSSYIYLLRTADDLDTPYFTVEIKPKENINSVPRLNQCYTYRDTTTKPDSLRQFIYDWASAKRFRICCKI